jgi:hypothetical protein
VKKCGRINLDIAVKQFYWYNFAVFTQQECSPHSQGVATMAFTGDLEHLPIVDVIQLLNSTRKTGVLSVKGRKGESQLVFKDGYIVSASHLNNSVRIGQVYVDKGMISSEQLEQALQRQQQDGENRRPLAITLIEMGILTENDAYKGLQHLIEMTVVEILTWKSGKFTLDHLTDVIDCDFKYYPEKMNHEINVNTQSILMDALRIFDEKKRDGLIEDEPEEPAAAELPPEEIISVDDLGLSEMDQLATSLPHAFSAVAPFDPLNFQRTKLQTIAPALSDDVREKIAGFLAKRTLPPEAEQNREGALPKIVLAGSDSLLAHALETAAKYDGICLTAAGSGEEVEALVDRAMLNGGRVRLVFDAPSVGGAAYRESMAAARKKLCSGYPGITCIQLVSAEALSFSLEAYRCGVRAVMPRPSLEARPDSFVEDFIALVEFLPSYLA